MTLYEVSPLSHFLATAASCPSVFLEIHGLIRLSAQFWLWRRFGVVFKRHADMILRGFAGQTAHKDGDDSIWLNCF